MLIHNRRRLALLAPTAGLLLALTACGGTTESQADSEGRDKISVRSDVYFNGAVLPLVVGVENGIFEEHDLVVDLNEGKGSATTIQTVGNGSDDIGYADAGTLVQSVAQGIDVKMIAGMIQDNPLALYALPDSGITEPEDLEGKTAGYTPGSAAERIFPAYAQATDTDETSIQFRNVDIPTRTELFIAEKTDFTFGLLNVSGPNISLKCDCEPVALPYSDAGIDMLSSGIIASSDMIEDRPEVLERFLEGLSESVAYVNDNPDEATQAFFDFASNSDVDETVVSEQWKISMDLAHTEATEGEPFGCTAQENWESTIELMEAYGDVSSDAVTVSDVATNSVHPDGCDDDLGSS